MLPLVSPTGEADTASSREHSEKALLHDMTAPAPEDHALEMLRVAGAAALWVHEAHGAAKQVTKGARACSYYSSQRVITE